MKNVTKQNITTFFNDFWRIVLNAILRKTLQRACKRFRFADLFNIKNISIYSAPVPKICPNGWKSRKGSCYKVFTDKVNWFQAQVIED